MVAIVAVVLSLLGVVAMVIGGYVLAAHRARASADLAALAGANAYALGQDACAAASRSATANHARVTSCRIEGTVGSFVLTLAAETRVGWTFPGAPEWVSAGARAGNA